MNDLYSKTYKDYERHEIYLNYKIWHLSKNRVEGSATCINIFQNKNQRNKRAKIKSVVKKKKCNIMLQKKKEKKTTEKYAS